MERVIKIGDAKIWTENNEILHLKLANDGKTNNKLNTNLVETYIKVITKLCNGKPMPFVFDLRDSKGTFTVPAVMLLAKSPALTKLRISEAFIFNSLGVKLLVISYKRIYDPITPFKLFTDMSAAKAYCTTIKKQVLWKH